MARIKIQEVIDHLSSDMRRALRAAINEVSPETTLDYYQLFRAFRRAVGRKCNTWENVPDNYIEYGD